MSGDLDSIRALGQPDEPLVEYAIRKCNPDGTWADLAQFAAYDDGWKWSSRAELFWLKKEAVSTVDEIRDSLGMIGRVVTVTIGD